MQCIRLKEKSISPNPNSLPIQIEWRCNAVGKAVAIPCPYSSFNNLLASGRCKLEGVKFY